MLTSSHSTILCPCIALPFPLEGVNAPAFGPPPSAGAGAPGIALSCSTLTRKQIRWHARGYLKARRASAYGRTNLELLSSDYALFFAAATLERSRPLWQRHGHSRTSVCQPSPLGFPQSLSQLRHVHEIPQVCRCCAPVQNAVGLVPQTHLTMVTAGPARPPLSNRPTTRHLSGTPVSPFPASDTPLQQDSQRDG